jgi:hypothetical protein
MMRDVVIVSALLLGFSIPVVAQETTGDIRGRLISASAPVAGATVTATSPDLLGTRSAASAGDGVFQLRALPPGIYTLRITRVGFAVTVIDSVAVRLGKGEGLPDTELKPANVQLSEVRIVAPRLTLDPARTTVGATLEAVDLASLPAERDYKSLVVTLPHVNTSYHGDAVNAGGSTGLENMYFIDGVNVTSPLTAATATSLPSNFVRSVEVRAGGYEAQYGRALGAIVNAVTYTGSNDFEANVFGFFTGDAIASSPRAQPTLRETGSMSYDVGGRVSGPVVRDRLWFSAAYNPRIDVADRVILGHGTFVDRRRADIFAGKLTWQPIPAQSVELSVFGDPATHDQVVERPNFASHTPITPDPFLQRRESGSATISLKSTLAVSSFLSVDVGVARAIGRERSFAATARGRSTPFYVDDVADSISGGFGFPEDVELSRTSAVLRGTFTGDRHTVVVGAEYEIARADLSFATPAGGVIFRTDTDRFTVDSQASAGVFRNRTPTVYAQDSWRVNDRLTLNLGVRWSSQFLISPSGVTAQRLPDEWQPRAGFSWQTGAESRERLFGSYGRFYQQEPLNLASIWYVDYHQTVKHFSVDPRTPGAAPDTVEYSSTFETDFAKSIDGVQAENFDEFTLGYERLLATARLTIRGIRRNLRSSFQWGLNPASTGTTPWVLGTPGEGDFNFLPRPRRDYTALEVGLDGRWRGLEYRSSYVWSRTWGNYSGLFASDVHIASPGGNFTLFMPHQASNSTGLLPNDRTHAVKFVATLPVGQSLRIGTFGTWQSGTPLNAFGAWAGGPRPPAFVVQRGTAGRTPGVWDLNLRVAHDGLRVRNTTARIVLDVLHLGNPRTAVRFDQQRWELLDAAGRQSRTNRNYRQPTAYQPPMTMRLGIEIGR